MWFLYFILSVGIVMAFASCSSNSGRFEVTNNTETRIDSIYIIPDITVGKKHLALLPKEKGYYETQMAGGGSDGSYRIYYKTFSEFKSARFGYFSNGIFLEKLIKIEILPD